MVLQRGGQPPAVVLRAGGGRLETLEIRDPIIGCLDGAVFDNAHLELAAGDTLLLYTDSLLDAHLGGERFGDERLHAFLADCAGRPEGRRSPARRRRVDPRRVPVRRRGRERPSRTRRSFLERLFAGAPGCDRRHCLL